MHPESREVLKTYAKGQYIDVVEVPAADGVTDLDALRQTVCENTAAVIVQYPNFFGRIEPLKDIEPIAHQGKSMFIVSANPLALGLLTPPGKFQSDIVSVMRSLSAFLQHTAARIAAFLPLLKN